VTLRQGPDTDIARAVLLSNYGQEELALDRLKDALACQPTVPYLTTLQAWYRFQMPPENNQFTSAAIDRVLLDFRPAFETPPDIPQPFFVRALLQATAGRWNEARSDLRQCRRKFGEGPFLTDVPGFNEWLNQAHASTSDYLEASSEVQDHLPVGVDQRIQLSQALLQRLEDENAVRDDGLAPEAVRGKRAWACFRLARLSAEKDDRPAALRYCEQALQANIPEVNADKLRNEAVGRWKDEEDFVKLLKPPGDTPPP
jgi:tetratricopeptide (TPR) repeat protein